MAIERTGFEILMQVDATPAVAGAQKVEEALGKVSQGTKDFNKELETGKEKLEQHGHNLQDGAKHAELFGAKHHEAHAAIHALGEELPGVGMLARDMWNPATFAIGIFSLGLGALIKQMEDASQEEQKMVDNIGKGVGATSRDLQEVMDQAIERNKRFWESLAGKEMDAAITRFALVAKGIEQVRKAQDAAEEADIQRQVRAGTMSQEEGQRRIGGIHTAAGARGLAANEGEIANRLEEERKRLGEAQGKMLTDAQSDRLAEDIKNAIVKAGTGDRSEDAVLKQKQAAYDTAQKAVDAYMSSMGVSEQGVDPRLIQERNAALVARDTQTGLVKSAHDELIRLQNQATENENARKIYGELGGPNGKVALDELALAVAKAVTAGVAAAPVGVAGAESLLDRGRAVLGDAANAQNYRQRTQSDAQITALLKDFTDFVAGHPTINGDVDRDLQNQINELRQQLRWNHFREQNNRNL